MDMTEDSKQKLDEVADVAKYFNSKIYIIAKHENRQRSLREVEKTM